MSMIVARMQKMKSENLIGIGNHNQRRTKGHSNPDIDSSRSHLNYDLVGRTENYKTDIEKFVAETNTATRAVRKDAVLVNEWIVTSDQSFFENLTAEETKKFFEVSKDFFADKFGEENIRYATVHMDETTPHMHLGVVPFDQDSKLSSKRVFNREALRSVQDDLPKILQDQGFEIKRGLEGSNRKNLTVPEFKRMKEEERELAAKAERSKKDLEAFALEKNISPQKIKFTREKKTKVVEAGRRNWLGMMEKEKRLVETENIIIPEKTLTELTKSAQAGKQAKAQLNKMLNTDYYKENQRLEQACDYYKAENKELVEKCSELVEDKQTLLTENNQLHLRIAQLQSEIESLYQRTRELLKERLGGMRAARQALKELAGKVANDLGTTSFFKKLLVKDDKKHDLER